MEFKINEFITLKLEAGTTVIYLLGKRFDQCKRVFLTISKESINNYDHINSIDEAIEMYNIIQDEVLQKDRAQDLITPEEEFWVHCSNLQVWAENNYDTRILHSNLSFPLLKKLADLNDKIAKRVFKDEVAMRFESGYLPVIKFLTLKNYLQYFSAEEIDTLFTNFNYDIFGQDLSTVLRLTQIFKRLGAHGAEKSFLEFYKDWIYEKFETKDKDAILSLINKGCLTRLSQEDIQPLLEKIDFELIMKQKDALLLFRNLMNAGVPEADKYYKDGIKKMIQTHSLNDNYVSAILSGMLDKFPLEFIKEIFTGFNFDKFTKQHLNMAPEFLKKIIGLGISEAEEYYKSHLFLNHYLISEEIPFFLDLHSTVNIPLNIYVLSEYVAGFTPHPPAIVVKDKSIIKVSLKGYHITEIPESISTLKNLIELDFSNTNLKDLPISMKFLSNLKVLDLSSNRLKTIPTIIFNLDFLEKLDLKINKINNIPEHISMLTSLHYLDLSRNKITSLPDIFTQLRNIITLDLSFNKLRFLPNNIGQLESLESLRIDYNALETLPTSIGNLKNLKEIHLIGNLITSIPESISSIKSLETLSINPKTLNLKSRDLIDLLLDKDSFICKPPFTIKFSLFNDESYFVCNDENTERAYGTYIIARRLPLGLSLITKLDDMFKRHYGAGKEIRTTDFISDVLYTIEEAERQLGKDFIIINQYEGDIVFYDNSSRTQLN